MRYLSFAPAAVALITAMACGGAPGDDPADTPPPPAAADEGPATWRLSADAFGPLRIGMTKQALMTLVPGAFDVPAPAEPGGCGYATWDRVPPGVRLMFAGDTLVRVEADSAQVLTILGAHVGDTEARIDSLYGPNVRRMPHKYTSGRYLIAFTPPPADTLHRVVFEADSAGRVTRLRAGRLPEVEWVEGCS
jgi:hypothetical protein